MGKEGSNFVKWFSELSSKDISIAGGKGSSLAEMYNNKFPIPPGFVVTAQAYSYFIEKSGLNKKIGEILNGLNVEDTKRLEESSKIIREMISHAEMTKEMEQEIIESYEILDVNKTVMASAHKGAMEILKNSHEPCFVAVRSSATTEDLAEASFAGQQESFLNIKGNKQLIQKVKECFASLFTARAVYYRTKKGFAHDKSYLSVVIQKMIDSQKSGVMFSKSPVSNKEEIMIEAVWGLGEGIVSGAINPDTYVVSRGDEFKILSEKMGNKKIAIVRASSGENKVVKLIEERSKQRVLTNWEIKKLAYYAMKLEEHYGKPQDIEFAISNEIYIVQSRPITTKYEMKDKNELDGESLLSGLGASPGVSYGPVKIIHDLNELDKIKKGDVLVTEMTNPDMVVSMQKAAAIITDEGGFTSHASIISREMGIPCVVGTENATKVLKDGMIVTVDGFNGKVYDGKGEKKTIEIKPIVQTKTKIKVIVDLPDYAERAALTGAKSVGLLRLEGIIAESGKHPLYFVKHGITEDYTGVIYSGLKKIAEYFEEIWVRSSDLRSDEYSHLEGAPQEKENNPMLGNHGIRFSLKHKEILEAELMAFKQLAKDFPNKVFGFMMPQVISVQEVKETKEMMNKIEMPGNVKLGIMVETPAAVQIINELCREGINFISFGTNDLTQYVLAIDRNNKDIQDLYNELNPAVLSAIIYVIRRCKKHKVETSICGQAASKLEMVKLLVKEGIDSLSVNADAAYEVSKTVAEIEKSGNFISVIEDKIENIFTHKEKKEEKQENKEIGIEKKEIEIAPLTAAMSKDIEEVILEELDNKEEKTEERSGITPETISSLPVADIVDPTDVSFIPFELLDQKIMESVSSVRENVESGSSSNASAEELLNEVEKDQVLDIF